MGCGSSLSLRKEYIVPLSRTSSKTVVQNGKIDEEYKEDNLLEDIEESYSEDIFKKYERVKRERQDRIKEEEDKMVQIMKRHQEKAQAIITEELLNKSAEEILQVVYRYLCYMAYSGIFQITSPTDKTGEILGSYVPSLVLNFFNGQTTDLPNAIMKEFYASVLFADISGL
jgi:hypothetical protein